MKKLRKHPWIEGPLIVSRIKRTTEWSTKTRPTSSSPWSSIKMNKYIWLFATLDNRQSRNDPLTEGETQQELTFKFTSFLSGALPRIVQRERWKDLYVSLNWGRYGSLKLLTSLGGIWLSTHRVRTWNAQLRAGVQDTSCTEVPEALQCWETFKFGTSHNEEPLL